MAKDGQPGPIDRPQPANAGDQPGQSPGRRPRTRQPPTPTQQAIALLSRREHSGKELQRKLQARGVPAADAHQAVLRVNAAGWQNETRFAESLVRSRIAGGYGPLHIRAELATHGLEEGVDTAFTAIGDGHADDLGCGVIRADRLLHDRADLGRGQSSFE